MDGLQRPRIEYRTPDDLVREVRQGRLRIPPFQRGFKWDADDVVQLFDSLRLGYPIGNLLLWHRSAPAQMLRVGPLDVDAPATDSALWVVDGQQRIVSLVGALTSATTATDVRFRIHLDVDSGKFTTVGPRQSVARSWVPLDVLLDTATLLRWMRQNSEWLSDEQIDLVDATAKAIREFQIPTYIVTSDDEAPLVEIFTRMNDSGKRLTKSDVFNALQSGFSAGAPSTLAGLGDLTADLGFGRIDERLALRCLLAHTGGDIFREDLETVFSTADDSREAFEDVATALRATVDFLRGPAQVPHLRLLPYSHVVPILVRFIGVHGVPEGRTATLLRRWVWRGAVAGARAGGISVPSIRQQAAAAGGTGPARASATALLAEVTGPYVEFVPALERVHFSHAVTKLNVLALAGLAPRDLRTGVPLDLVHLLDEGSPLQTVLAADPAGRTLANRIIAPSGPAAPRRAALAAAEPTIAASHGVDPRAQEALRRGHDDEFLVKRAQTLQQTISTLVNAQAEWGARDGAAISDMLRQVG